MRIVFSDKTVEAVFKSFPPLPAQMILSPSVCRLAANVIVQGSIVGSTKNFEI